MLGKTWELENLKHTDFLQFYQLLQTRVEMNLDLRVPEIPHYYTFGKLISATLEINCIIYDTYLKHCLKQCSYKAKWKKITVVPFYSATYYQVSKILNELTPCLG